MLTLVVLPIANEIVNRAKWTTAQSLLQIVVRALQLPFGRLPLIGEVLGLLSKPPAQLPPTEQGAKAPLGPLLIVVASLGASLILAGCGSTSSLYRATAEAAVVASQGYRALDKEDATRELAIATRAKQDDVSGATQLRDSWRPTYQAVRLVLDDASRLIEEAWSLQRSSAGSAPSPGAARDTLERLSKATREIVTALASIGVQSSLVTGGAQ